MKKMKRTKTEKVYMDVEMIVRTRKQKKNGQQAVFRLK